jgi:Ni,Fe-hydrogenase maturation factor
MKILCLGNEFIEEDSFAKEIADELKKEFEIVFIKHSFELLNYRKEKMIILDVVEKTEEVLQLKTHDLKNSRIITGHDFDAGFFLKLLDMNVAIIGIPMKGNKKKIKNQVREILIRAI